MSESQSDQVRGQITALSVWIECVLQAMPKDQQKQALIALQRRTPETLKMLEVMGASAQEVAETRDAFERHCNATAKVLQASILGPLTDRS